MLPRSTNARAAAERRSAASCGLSTKANAVRSSSRARLWPSQDTHLGAAQQSLRPPARALSHWHLALALAAGAISGVVRSKTGRVLVVKGDTHKDKTLQREFTEREDGSIAETRILTDKFVPVIRAWDMTPGSATPQKLGKGFGLKATSGQSESGIDLIYHVER